MKVFAFLPAVKMPPPANGDFPETTVPLKNGFATKRLDRHVGAGLIIIYSLSQENMAAPKTNGSGDDAKITYQYKFKRFTSLTGLSQL